MKHLLKITKENAAVTSIQDLKDWIKNFGSEWNSEIFPDYLNYLSVANEVIDQIELSLTKEEYEEFCDELATEYLNKK